MTAREVLLAWAKSPGFAAIHNGQATDEQIVDDLGLWLGVHGVVLISKTTLDQVALREALNDLLLGLDGGIPLRNYADSITIFLDIASQDLTGPRIKTFKMISEYLGKEGHQ